MRKTYTHDQERQAPIAPRGTALRTEQEATWALGGAILHPLHRRDPGPLSG